MRYVYVGVHIERQYLNASIQIPGLRTQKRFVNAASGHQSLVAWAKQYINIETLLFVVLKRKGDKLNLLAYLQDQGLLTQVVSISAINTFATSSRYLAKASRLSSHAILDYAKMSALVPSEDSQQQVNHWETKNTLAELSKSVTLVSHLGNKIVKLRKQRQAESVSLHMHFTKALATLQQGAIALQQLVQEERTF